MRLYRETARAGCVIALLLFGALRCASAAAIDVRVDRDPASMEESFQVIFQASGDVDDDPDFSPLDRDFEVLSRAHSSNISIVNGRTSRLRTWTLTLLARREGSLSIPSIAFGKDRSPALPLTVVRGGTAPGKRKPGTGAGTGSGEVFLEVEAKPLKTWVQAEVIYTVRLFRSVPTSNATLSDPVVENGGAVIEKLGEDRGYDTQVMGRQYEVVERSFAVYPQSSGTITIQPVQFQGRAGRMPFSLMDPFGPQPQTLVRQSAPVTIEVAPVPAGSSGGHWLPARQLHFSDAWSKDPPKFRVGEPITRTLTLTANGLTAGQLPEIPAWVPDGFKSYPDQPVLRDARSPAGILGTREEKTALIPSRAGNFKLPEIRMQWWDTTTGKLEQAVLPPRRINVLPAEGVQGSGATGAPAVAPDSATGPESRQPEAEQTSSAGEGAAAAPDQFIWQALSLVFGAGWLLTLLWLWRGRAGKRHMPSPKADSSSGAVRDLRQACKAGDAARAKDALLLWARSRWQEDPPVSIGDLQARAGEALSTELAALNRALYANGGASWEGQRLWQAFAAEQQQRSAPPTAAEPQALEPLHRL